MFGCSKKVKADNGPVNLVQTNKSHMPPLEKESAAFYWFNSRVVVDQVKGIEGFYGSYAYTSLLPQLSVNLQKDPAVWFALLDGDCMVNADHLLNYFRSEDRLLLEQAKQAGENLCYVIAVMRRGGARSWQDIDFQLRSSKTVGYMGMTMPAQFNAETFLNCTKIMSLPVAARIDGDRFTKISFGLLTDEQLKNCGFQPVVSN